jgi:hypothetical protein
LKTCLSSGSQDWLGNIGKGALPFSIDESLNYFHSFWKAVWKYVLNVKDRDSLT